ncbi:DEKNAAC101965 [Brettanomyces naardenensis]|uniref:DEKNAAC101965 n=1 Tax=Brettanomyces naardenensis TaxID=13370 RepID=A0A448YJG5_BRENA|nr:DEKNAAC101965 [Brettanomyces naardenensis]
MTEDESVSIYTEHLFYQYPNTRIGLFDININLLRGSRLLLVGPNGAGKSTLLKILAGQRLIKSGKVLLNGKDPFDMRHRGNQIVTYLGTEWANNEITKRDIPVTVLVESVGGDFYKERRDMLINLLDIDITWRMNQCSDGERRRVQLCMGLLKPWDLLLLDEVTVDLDVLVRYRLLEFLRKETEQRNCTIVYATHIFDGLGEWPTEVMHLNGGIIVKRYVPKDIHFVNESKQPVEEEDIKEDINKQRHERRSVVLIQKIKSFYPLALKWLKEDLGVRGERTDDTSKPKYEELTRRLVKYYYDDKDRIGEYFTKTQQ